jgi:hypothetical protein
VSGQKKRKRNEQQRLLNEQLGFVSVFLLYEYVWVLYLLVFVTSHLISLHPCLQVLRLPQSVLVGRHRSPSNSRDELQ